MSETLEEASTEKVTPQPPVDRLLTAEALVRKNVYVAVGVGIVPIPLLDLVAFNGIQLNMLYRLSKLYDVPFRKEAAKSVIATLVSGSGAALLTAPAWSMLKAIPVVGSAVGGLTVSILAGASTYALGRVFIQHFESGGTFLTFDPRAVRDQYARLQEEGRKVAQEASAVHG